MEGEGGNGHNAETLSPRPFFSLSCFHRDRKAENSLRPFVNRAPRNGISVLSRCARFTRWNSMSSGR